MELSLSKEELSALLESGNFLTAWDEEVVEGEYDAGDENGAAANVWRFLQSACAKLRTALNNC